MQRVGRVDLAVKVGIGGLDSQQITVRPGIEPLLIDLARLLPQGEGDSQRRIIAGVDGLYGLEQAGDFAHKGCVSALSALDYHRAETPLRRNPGRCKYLFFRQFVALAADVPADSAVKAVLDAPVRNLDEPAQVDLRPDGRHLHAVSLVQERLFECGVFTGNGGGESFAVQCEI